MTPADIALLIGGPLLMFLFLYEMKVTHKKLVLKWRGIFRFPISLLISTFAVLGLSLLYAKVNPYVIYSYPNGVFFSFFSLAFVIQFVILAGTAKFRGAHHQSTAVLGELFLLWWIIVAIDLRGLLDDRAFFFAPFLYMSAALSLSAKFLNALREPTGEIRLPTDDDHSGASNSANGNGAHPVQKHTVKIREWASGVCASSVIVVVITMATQLAFFITLMVMKNKWFRFQLPRDILLVDATALLFLVLPFATFMHKLHWVIPAFFSLVFIGTFVFSLLIFPFTGHAPAYLEFTQVINLDNGTNVVRLSGPRDYTDKQIVPLLPSYNQSADFRECHGQDEGIRGQPASSFCIWHGLAPPDPPADLLNVYKSEVEDGMAKLWVKYSYQCTGYGLEFLDETPPQYEGISRSEDRVGGVTEYFKVWIPDDSPGWTIRVSCVWHKLSPKYIPAFTEVEEYEPRWARVGKDDGVLMTAERFMKI